MCVYLPRVVSTASIRHNRYTRQAVVVNHTASGVRGRGDVFWICIFRFKNTSIVRTKRGLRDIPLTQPLYDDDGLMCDPFRLVRQM